MLSNGVQSSSVNLDSALAQHSKSQPVIVDFDGTILLRSSTEAYLDAAWPRQIAALLLAVIDATRPWRFLPGKDRMWLYRDWLRVAAVTVLLPWSALLWRRRAVMVARRHMNVSLLERLAPWPSASIFVATFGFRLIVAPLLKSIAPEMKLVVAGSFLGGFRLRRTGKALALQRAIGADVLSASLVITDSMDDGDLAPVSAGMVLIDCPPEAHSRALQDCFIPFLYLIKVKRPKEGHLLRQVLNFDLVVLFISYAFRSAYPVLIGASLLLLQVSFWMIYEIGYWENDVIGSLYEASPVIRSKFSAFKDQFDPVWAWGLALFVGLLGAAALNQAAAARIAHAGLPPFVALIGTWVIWTLYLCGVRSVFWVYNRIDTMTRVFIYPVLQIAKTLGWVVLLPISFIGSVLCVTVVLTRWIPYIVYRYGGARWETPGAVLQLVMFNFLIIALVLAAGQINPLVQPEVWFIEIWFLLLARKQIAALIRGAVWLPGRPGQRPGPQSHNQA